MDIYMIKPETLKEGDSIVLSEGNKLSFSSESGGFTFTIHDSDCYDGKVVKVVKMNPKSATIELNENSNYRLAFKFNSTVAKIL